MPCRPPFLLLLLTFVGLLAIFHYLLSSYIFFSWPYTGWAGTLVEGLGRLVRVRVELVIEARESAPSPPKPRKAAENSELELQYPSIFLLHWFLRPMQMSTEWEYYSTSTNDAPGNDRVMLITSALALLMLLQKPHNFIQNFHIFSLYGFC